METNELLTTILAKLETLESGQQSLQNNVKGLQKTVSEMQTDVADIKDRTKKIEITLENDITRRLDSLADGYKLNGEKLDSVKEVVDDLDSTVTALDVLAQFQNNKPITLQIIK